MLDIDQVYYSVKLAHVVLSYNHPHLTEKCLLSLIQNNPHNKPIFLIHNGSASEHKKYLINKFSNLIHIEISENQGFSGGANIGINKAFLESNWVFFHTNDTQTLDLPSIIPTKSGIYTPLIWRRNTLNLDSAGGFVDLKSFKPFHYKNKEEFNQSVLNFKMDQNSPFAPYIPGTAFLIDKNTWNDLGGFDTCYHTYWEDIDLSFRALRKNKNLQLISEWVLKHSIGKTCHKNPFYTKTLFWRNRQIFYNKYFKDKLNSLEISLNHVDEKELPP